MQGDVLLRGLKGDEGGAEGEKGCEMSDIDNFS